MKKVFISVTIALIFILSEAKEPESYGFLAVTIDAPGKAFVDSPLSGASEDNYIFAKYVIEYSSGTQNIMIGLNESLGGYVFYVTPDGQHGLVAATQDQSTSSDWYYAQDVISNPDNHNTDGRKFLDWRLPTKFELNLMYTQKTAIGGFVNNYYWNSIMNGSTYAWIQNFGTGNQDYGPKDGTFCVRAVRSF